MIPQFVKELNINEYEDYINRFGRDFRICARALAWNDRQWWLKPSAPEKCLYELVEHAIADLKQGKTNGSVATGGFKVSYRFDEDSVDIDISLELGSLHSYSDGSDYINI